MKHFRRSTAGAVVLVLLLVLVGGCADDEPTPASPGGGGESPKATATPPVTPTPSGPVRVGEGTIVLESTFDSTMELYVGEGHDYQTETGKIPFLIMRESGKYTVEPVSGIGSMTWTDTFASEQCSFEIEAETTPTISGTANPAECTMEVTIIGKYTSGTVKSQNCPGAVEPVWPGSPSTFGPYELDMWDGASRELGGSQAFKGTLTVRDLWLDKSILCLSPE